MKSYKYVIVFTSHNLFEVMAFGLTEALILAKAEQIKKGNSFVVDHVKFYRWDGNPYIYRENLN